MAASDKVSTRFLLSPQKSGLPDQGTREGTSKDKHVARTSSPQTARCGTVPAAISAVCRDSATVELEEIEITASPATVFFKIRVCPFGRGVSSHHVMKTYHDLQNLHEAILRETPETIKLPSLPSDPMAGELPTAITSAFQAWVGKYLSDLSRCEAAVETHSFGNFFDLTEERRKPQGRGLLPLSEPELGDARSSSDQPVAPKSAPGGLSSASSSSGVCKSPTDVSSKLDMPTSKSPCIATGDSKGPGTPEEVSSPQGLPTCILCFSRPQEMAVVPCGHLSMCDTCSRELKECPLCRGPIDKLLRIYAVE